PGAATGASAGGHRRVYRALRPASGHRGDALARRSPLPLATDALLRTGENPSRPCADRHGPQLSATRGMVPGCPAPADAPLALRQAHGPRAGRLSFADFAISIESEQEPLIHRTVGLLSPMPFGVGFHFKIRARKALKDQCRDHGWQDGYAR